MGFPNSASTITKKLNDLATERARGNTDWMEQILSMLNAPGADLTAYFNMLATRPIVAGPLTITAAQTAKEVAHLTGGDFRDSTKWLIMDTIRNILAENADANYDVDWGSQDPGHFDVEVSPSVSKGKKKYDVKFRAP